MAPNENRGGPIDSMIANEITVPTTVGQKGSPSAIVDGHPQGTPVGGRRIDVGLRWFLAAILVWAGLSKLVDPSSFYGAMLEYQLPLPRFLLKVAALTLPWLELFCGLLIVTNIARQAVLAWVTALFAVFLVMVGQAFLRGLDISCGCFDLSPFGIGKVSKLGHFIESVGFATLRNVVLFAAALFLWRTAPPHRSEQE